MTKSIHHLWRLCSGGAAVIILGLGLSGSALASSGGGGGSDFRITSASWSNYRDRLTVRGYCDRSRDITVTKTNAYGSVIGSDECNDGRWEVRISYSDTSDVPCHVYAKQSDGESDERDVYRAPSDCDDGGGTPPPGGGGFQDQTDFKIMMNYELGMHCTGFEFAYCCVLPAYNSILAQVVKPNKSGRSGDGDQDFTFPELLEGDPNEGLDGLGRETVVRDKALDGSGNFKKYVLKYWHEAQPRTVRGKPQSSTLISAVEGNSMLSWNTTFDSAMVIDGVLQYDSYNGADDVLKGNGLLNDPTDNYQNAIWNHLYFYNGLEGDFACSEPLANKGNRCSEDADCGSGGVCNVTTDENQKIRLGVSGQPGPFLNVAYPTDCGPAFHPMGPKTSNGLPIGDDPNNLDNPLVDNNCGEFSNGNVLTFSGHQGTVVYTQMKVLENLPIMLTSPDIWEALGLPLTPFEDSIGFFADPGLVNEDSVRPFVAMKAQMFNYDSSKPDGAGSAVMDSRGDPVIGFGTAPIDIPNCERCHSNPADGTEIANSAAEGGGMLTVDNSPNNDPAQYALVQVEYNFWNAYYGIDTGAGDSDWYSRLKSAAISMLNGHDIDHGTSFAANYPGCGDPVLDPDLNDPTDTTGCGDTPQNTRLGHESVICQRCHADNVIAVVKSATKGGVTIKPITEAIHNNHLGVSNGGPIAFSDSLGRDGGCQGCHPAHRSNGDMDGYPITLAGTNKYADGDNRGANGGCFVGRDVHSNPGKDSDGAGTPPHLNVVGQYLADNVFSDDATGPDNAGKGIWCTNCHNQLGQKIWSDENMVDLVRGVPGKEADLTTDAVNIRALPTLAQVATAVGLTELEAIAMLDPTDNNPEGDFTHEIWNPDSSKSNVAIVEVTGTGGCTAGYGPYLDPTFGIDVCAKLDVDGDPSYRILEGFCTTPDCVTLAQATLDGEDNGGTAAPVPFYAATDGGDHWLSAGEPHCADCHAAPYVEQSGNINAYPPFNYPRKASLMRYSKGHQGITCQGCHESIHGLYPVTPNIDTTSYAQAAALNDDGSHGPLKCGTCHDVDSNDIPTWVDDLEYNDLRIGSNFDRAVSWMHTFTAEADPRQDVCLNCHGDEANEVSWRNDEWTEHAMKGRTSRQTMDTVEALEEINMNDPRNTLCESCHGDEWREVSCNDKEWKEHLTEGRVSEAVWEDVSVLRTGTTCGW